MAFQPSHYMQYPTQQNPVYKDYLQSMLRQREQQVQHQIQNLYLLQQPQNSLFLDTVKLEPKIEAKQEEIYSESSHFSTFDIKTEIHSAKTEESESNNIIFEEKKSNRNAANEELKSQITTMLHFFLTKFDKVSQEEIDQERSKYINNQSLLELFDNLLNKYMASSKCREDMIRFIIRKALSTLRDDIRMKQNLSLKSASVVLCKKYFQFMSNEDIKEKVDIGNEEELISFLLPYKRNSRNKTANTCFITEIFSSEAFYQDYKEYLAKLDKILRVDNQSKIQRFTNFLVKCVKDRSLNKIRGFKRLPWPEAWVESTKVVANELLNANTWKNINKKPKVKGVKKVKLYQ